MNKYLLNLAHSLQNTKYNFLWSLNNIYTSTHPFQKNKKYKNIQSKLYGLPPVKWAAGKKLFMLFDIDTFEIQTINPHNSLNLDNIAKFMLETVT